MINNALHISLGIYHDSATNRDFYATDREPTLDAELPLWHIGGLDNFSIPRPSFHKVATGAVRGSTSGSGPGGDFLGSDRRAAYYGGTTLTGAGQTVGLFELDGYDSTDVSNYFTNVGQPLNVPINNVLLLGASGGSDGDDTEQVIDIIESVSMAPALSQVLVYIGPESSFSSGSTDTDIFNQMASDDTANQISVSWAWSPDDPTDNDPIFQQMASQGQTVFVASGDYGAWPNSDGFYYPAEDPYVTAVGGTNLTTSGAGGPWASETAWGGSATSCYAGTGSGGGPSPDSIPIPGYQQISGVITSTNSGSTTVRNVPDVAAEANCDNYYCANGSCGGGLGGTSLAAPTWAGFMALVNQQNSSLSLPTEGFINWFAYLNGSSSASSSFFNDVTTGDNFNADNPYLYSATTGYDLVTGWGSPVATGWLSTGPVQTLPVYRFHNGIHHFYTLSYSEGVDSGYYTYEGVGWYLFSSAPSSGYIPLYRCFVSGTLDHFVSTESNCEGATVESTMGYASSASQSGFVALYRFFKSSASDHLITTNYSEGPANGYTFESVLGYVPTI